MARQTLIDDDGIIVEQRVKVSGEDELEYWKDFVNVHNNSPRTTLHQACDIAEQCKTYAETALESNTLKQSARSVLERQLKDANGILGCAWAVQLHSETIPKEYQDALQWAIVEAFNMGRSFERLRVRPASPHAKTGKKVRDGMSEGRRKTVEQRTKESLRKKDEFLKEYRKKKKANPHLSYTEITNLIGSSQSPPRSGRQVRNIIPKFVAEKIGKS
ncbi:MAG: hypothetical protein GHCLOJNM_03238 [bacterium]|nr:hypothetical protein [bacterium]